MSKRGKKANVGRLYRQQVLSGFERAIQPGDTNSDSETVNKVEDVTQADISKERCYQVSITFIIDKVGDDRDRNLYNISVNDDTDIFVTPISRRSKKPTKPPVTVHQKTNAKTTKIPLVYGVHESGLHTLSPSPIDTLPNAIAQLYSYVLVQANRALERIVFKPKEQAGNDDSGKREESTPTQKSVGTDKKARRSKKIRSEVLPKTVPEETAKMDDTDG